MIETTKIKALLVSALSEDIGTGDITTKSTVSEKSISDAEIIAKEDGIICGLPIIEYIFDIVDSSMQISLNYKDGDHIRKGDIVVKLHGSSHSILSTERTILNFLQNLSGVATTANIYAKKLKDTKTRVLDTRKTIPGLRYLQKYAVTTGGAMNHRLGLYDMILIKDNHIKANGSITDAVKKSRSVPDMKIEVECDTLEQAKEAAGTDCDWIMLDNMDIQTMKKAMKLIKKQKVEASGGITLDNIQKIAETGVDYISIGAITHSYKSLDLSMKIS